MPVALLHFTVDFNINLVQDAAALYFLLRSVITYYNFTFLLDKRNCVICNVKIFYFKCACLFVLGC